MLIMNLFAKARLAQGGERTSGIPGPCRLSWLNNNRIWSERDETGTNWDAEKLKFNVHRRMEVSCGGATGCNGHTWPF